MKTICFIAILCFALKVEANDTLTRAQVYNFSVGDTFDYRNYKDIEKANDCGPLESIISIGYNRYVISNIFYSLDSSTKYITRQRAFPQPLIFDTLTLQNLSGYEVNLDLPDCNGHGTITIDTSRYQGRTYNMLMQSGCNGGHNPIYYDRAFVAGLGTVLRYSESGAYGCYETDSIELIYYSKGSETWGTPYYNFPTGISELSNDETRIILSPTLNNGAFDIKVTNASLLPVSIMIYDVTGREVKRTTLNNAENNLNIAPCAGMYIWKAVTKDRLIKTGKIVIH